MLSYRFYQYTFLGFLVFGGGNDMRTPPRYRDFTSPTMYSNLVANLTPESIVRSRIDDSKFSDNDFIGFLAKIQAILDMGRLARVKSVDDSSASGTVT